MSVHHWRRVWPSSCREAVFALVLVVSALAASRGGAEPQLASLVPGDAGLCVEVADLAARLDEFRTTELYRRVCQFPPLRKFLAANGAQLADLASELRRQTGLAPDELLRRLLGHRLLVAVWPATTDVEASPGPALLLLDCEDQPLLDGVVDRLLEAERRAGRRVSQLDWQHDDSICTIHRIDAGSIQPPLFIAVVDRLGIVATDPAVVVKVLDLRAGLGQTASLADQPAYRAGMARLNPQAFVRLFINPRAWDACFAEHSATANDLPGGTWGWLAEQFRTADYLVLSCQLGANVVVEGFLHSRADQLADAAERESQRAAPHADLAERLPSGAVAAFAGRVDLAMLLGAFFRERPAPDIAASGTDGDSHDHIAAQALATLIAGRGHETVAALLRRPWEEKDVKSHADRALPSGEQPAADWVVGFDTHSLLPDDRLAFDERLNPFLRGMLTAAIMMYNRQGQTMKIESVEEEGVPLTTVDGLALLGQGDTATFSLLRGYFWAGTCRTVVRDTARLDAEQSLAADARFQSLASSRMPIRSHLAYFDLAALRGLLPGSAGRDSHAAERVAADGGDGQPAVGQGRDLTALMALADRLLVEIQIDSSGVGVSASATADVPR